MGELLRKIAAVAYSISVLLHLSGAAEKNHKN
jgi:hypothetical protein